MIDFYEKIGNYTLDVSKYILTGVVIATFFKSFDNDGGRSLYLIGIVSALVFMFISYIAYNIYNKNEKRKQHKKGGKK